MDGFRCTRQQGVDMLTLRVLLLTNGADINATEWEGLTALHLASMNSRSDVVPLLLEWGANVQARCLYGKTPSQYALSLGYRNIVRLLSENVVGRV